MASGEPFVKIPATASTAFATIPLELDLEPPLAEDDLEPLEPDAFFADDEDPRAFDEEPPDFEPERELAPAFEDLEEPPDFDERDEPPDFEDPDEPPDFEEREELADLEVRDEPPAFEPERELRLFDEEPLPDFDREDPDVEPEDFFFVDDDFADDEPDDLRDDEPDPDPDDFDRDPEPDDFDELDFEPEDFLVVAILFPPITDLACRNPLSDFANNIPFINLFVGSVADERRVEFMRLTPVLIRLLCLVHTHFVKQSKRATRNSHVAKDDQQTRLQRSST